MAFNPVDDADDLEVQAAQANEQKRLKAEQDAADIRWLMSQPQGLRFITRVLEETAVHRTSFHNSGQVMALNEGRKMVGYWLVGELTEHAPEPYFNLLRSYARS
jgi:hypothetical protein